MKAGDSGDIIWTMQQYQLTRQTENLVPSF